jgi:fibronectin-binding autotransporter adhesin
MTISSQHSSQHPCRTTRRFNALRLPLPSLIATLLLASLPDADVRAADLQWGSGGAGGAGTWNTTSSNWYNGTANTNWNSATPDSAIFGGTAGTVTLGAPITVSNITFNTGGYTIAGSNLTLSSSTITANANATISSVLAGTTGLTLAGAGTMTLSGANTFSGNFISSGTGFRTLQLGNDSALGSSTVFWGQNLIVSSDGATARTIGNTINLANVQYYGSATGTGDLNFTGTNVAAATRILLVSNSTTISGVVSGAGGLDKRGAGTLTLSGNNINSGTTTLQGGTLRVGSDSALGTGGFTITSGTLASAGATARTLTNAVTMGGNVQLGDATGTGALSFSNINLGAATRTLTVSNSTTVAGVISGTAGLTLAGTGTVTLSGSNSFSGPFTAGGGTGMTLRLGSDNALGAGTASLGQNLLLTSDGAATRTIGNTVNLANVAYYGDATGTGDLIFTGSNVATGNERIMVVSNSTTISGVVSGTGGLDKRGAGTLTLSGNNTYASGTTVNAGSLIINGNQSSATGVLNVAAGATLGGSGTIGGATTISGIHRPGNSAGVQTFASDLTYSGTPTVQWELTANTTTQGSPTPVFDQIVVNGNLDFAVPTALTLNFALPGSAVDWSDGLWASNITGTSGWLVYDVGGALSNLTNFSISVENWADGQGDLFNTVRAGSSFSLYNDNVSGDIYLNYAVPEPSTYALIMLAGAGLMAHRWRNRRRCGGGASGQ